MKPGLTHETQPIARLDPNWKNILECAAIEVFEMMAGSRLSPHPNPPAEPAGELTAMVGLAGGLCGLTTIQCTSGTAAKLASRMLGEDAPSNSSTMADAMGELCNMVAGNFEAQIVTLSDHCLLSVPTVIRGENYVMQTAQPHESYQVALMFEDSPIWVSLIIQS
jgi:chemotaxis protein CheX